jgi:hypothetical protein
VLHERAAGKRGIKEARNVFISIIENVLFINSILPPLSSEGFVRK